MEKERILFAGTPEIAVPLLTELAKTFNVVGVLTNCDKSVGRSKALVPTPVKQKAMELGLPVLQFDTLKTEARTAVRALGANTLVTFAFGKMFGPLFLNLFSNGTFNVHPSALPLFRGPSPIQATIHSGLRECTISLQTIGLGMDEGDIWGTHSFPLMGNESTQGLTQKVSEEAAFFVPKQLRKVFAKEVTSYKQEGEATYCHMIAKEDGVLDFTKTALELHCQVRACYPWPKAWARVNGNDIAITGVWGGFEELENEEKATAEPGTVIGLKKGRGLGIACSDKVLYISSLQLPSKKEMDAASFVNGNRWILEAKFE